jgi:uncharacterized membrane protein
MRKVAFAAAAIIRFLIAPLFALGLIVAFIVRLIKWSFSPWWVWPLAVCIIVALNTVGRITMDATQDEIPASLTTGKEIYPR